MPFQVEYTTAARTDLDQAYQWISEQSASPETAFRWFNEISQAIASLDQNPQRCGLAPEDDYFTQEIRQLLHGKPADRYRILFTIDEKTVVILHIRHSARRYLGEQTTDKR